MGTSGLYGFKYRGRYYLMYSRRDSYPSGLGTDLLVEIRSAIKEGRIEDWKRRVLELQVVSDSDVPPEEAVIKLKPYYSGLRGESPQWSTLLGRCGGSFERILNAGYYMDGGLTARNLVNDLLFQYCYVLDFDEDKLCVYGSIAGLYQEISLSDIDERTAINEPEENEDQFREVMLANDIKMGWRK
jgi:hypothetical protein